MKNLVGVMIFVVVAWASLPFMGFWIVAIVGIFAILLAFVAVVDIFFPVEEWLREKAKYFAKYFAKNCEQSQSER